MATETGSIFRKVALDRLSSPEQLDALMRVITPQAWLAFAPLAILIAAAIAWGWFGSVPTKVIGKCILINPTGLADVVATAAGRIIALDVTVGDTVRRGQRIARIAQPDLEDRIDQARARLEELRARARMVRSFSSQSTTLNDQALAQQRQNLESQLKAAGERERIIADRALTQTRLLEQGLVTNQTLLATRQEQTAARLEAENLRNQIRQLSLRRLEGERANRNEMAAIGEQVNEARRALDSLLANEKRVSVVTSAFDGRIVEVKTGRGMRVETGGAVVSVERTDAADTPLEAAVFVPAADGKRVERGMTAEVTPSTVKREESGFLVARVSYVSEYPSTQQSMNALLHNEPLVRELAGATPPIEIRAALLPESNYSGYRWSSAGGAQLKIRSGTLCSAEIVVERQRPITLVVPALKKALGVE
ncbi:MAG: NHLP bacteriocin system secretion protein [Betaproteobacteria bacterium RIFCSPLOWO2_12_FULL_63_13]|nr:MAG: NHLP bacteriocin system secretion protein [Betaproteobacteria bacterium RIFCSPLOWO2_12_FULL_63_13]